MDIEKIKLNRMARASRNNRPLKTFMDIYSSTDKALKEVVSLGASLETQETLVKSHVINLVTAVEVYYRDMLDSIFRMCVPSSYKDILRKLHDHAYKIDDLVSMYEADIHPLELIANSHSFQNKENIERVFKIVLGDSFFKKIQSIKWRIKDSPESESEISYKDIEALQSIFEYRHSLIHNPNQKLSESLSSIEGKINSIFGVITASDIVLSSHINENLDPELKA